MLNLIVSIILLTAVAAPVAILAGWFVGSGHEGLGSLTGGAHGYSGPPHAMHWPRGVQEEDGVAWHVRSPDPALGSGAGSQRARSPHRKPAAKRRPLVALQDHLDSVAAGQPARVDNRKALS